MLAAIDYEPCIEYWIFSIPWLVHFCDAWEHSTGESLWEMGPAERGYHLKLETAPATTTRIGVTMTVVE